MPRTRTRHSPILLWGLAGCYLILLLPLAVLLPLRLGELLQAFASLDFSWPRFFSWIARTPDGGPIGFLAQLPLAIAGPHNRLLLRLPSVLSGVAACIVIFRFAKQIPIQSPLLATLAFALLPAQLQISTQARPFALALLFAVLAAAQFAQLLKNQTVASAALYTFLLTCCLYTEPTSFLPAIGYVVFLLRFAGGVDQRRALWHILPATALAALLYLPYYAWADPQHSADWLTEILVSDQLWIWSAILLTVPLIFGIWSTFLPFNWPLAKRTLLFCLAGGSLTALVAGWLLASHAKVPFDPNQVTGALPGLIILSFTGLEWLSKGRGFFAVVLCVALVALSFPANLQYATSPATEIAELTYSIPRRLTADSCVVFVSQHESPYFFLLYDPSLATHECSGFFHHRILLASHPWVTPQQQAGAESFFRGLNFVPIERHSIAGGQIVIMESEK